MREILFRAWDGEKMIYHEWEKYVIQFDGTIGHFNGKTYDTVNWKLMQFTGLHDKNGNKIFEGDITVGLDVIMWCNECIGYQAHYKYNDEFICNFCDGDFHLRDEGAFGNIIGNIYENPDLSEQL